jgi:hypothetical protein
VPRLKHQPVLSFSNLLIHLQTAFVPERLLLLARRMLLHCSLTVDFEKEPRVVMCMLADVKQLNELCLPLSFTPWISIIQSWRVGCCYQQLDTCGRRKSTGLNCKLIQPAGKTWGPHSCH